MLVGMEPFYCCTKRDSGTVISRDTPYQEVKNRIREGHYSGCGALLVPYRSGNMYRTIRAVDVSEVEQKIQYYSPNILSRSVQSRESLNKSNHSNHFTESKED